MTSLEPETVLWVSLDLGVEVTVTVSECLTQCCGGGWQRRDDGSYPLIYTGRVVRMQDGALLLHMSQLGRITQVLAELKDVLDAQFVD